MDYTPIIKALIVLLGTIVTCVLVPYIRQKYGAEKLNEWAQYISIAVAAAEQLFDTKEGEAKKRYVLEYLKDKGVTYDAQTIDNMIEAEVLKLHAAIKWE